MKTLIIYAHPRDTENSVSYKLVQDILKHNTDIEYKEINKDGSVDDMNYEREQLTKYNRIIFAFPFWWYNLPWNLKRYIDDVMEYGYAYGNGGDKLKHIEFGYITVSGGPSKSYQPGQYNQVTYFDNLRSLQSSINLFGGTFLTPWIISKFDINNGLVDYNKFVENVAKDITDPLYNPYTRYAK